MNEIKIFENPEFGKIRTVKADEEVWFVAVDVCSALGIKNSCVALSRLDDDEKNTLSLNEGITGNPNKGVVNEYGLYRLTIGSRKKEAEKFKRWIVHDVLPSIRKNGAYITPTKIQEIILNPDTIIQLAQALKQEQAKSSALENKVKELESSKQVEKSLNVGESAMLLNSKYGLKTGRVLLFKFLRDNRFLGFDNLPFDEYVKNGWFEVRRVKHYTANGNPIGTGKITMITPEGIEQIAKLMKEELD